MATSVALLGTGVLTGSGHADQCRQTKIHHSVSTQTAEPVSTRKDESDFYDMPGRLRKCKFRYVAFYGRIRKTLNGKLPSCWKLEYLYLTLTVLFNKIKWLSANSRKRYDVSYGGTLHAHRIYHIVWASFMNSTPSLNAFMNSTPCSTSVAHYGLRSFLPLASAINI